MASLEQAWWRHGVMRSTDEQLAEALSSLSKSLEGSTLTEYPEPEFILREAARRLRTTMVLPGRMSKENVTSPQAG